MPFQFLPGLSGPEFEQVGVAPLHLPFEVACNILRGELVEFLGQDQLPCEMKEQIGHLIPDGTRVPDCQCMIQLENFFHKVGSERFPSLNPIPRAPVSEV
jgi:hypothetical protein